MFLTPFFIFFALICTSFFYEKHPQRRATSVCVFVGNGDGDDDARGDDVMASARRR